MLNLFTHYQELQKIFSFRNTAETVWLVVGGVTLGLLEMTAITIIFPLMMIMIDPTISSRGGIVGRIYRLLGFTAEYQFAIFLTCMVISVFTTKVVLNLVFLRYEYSVLRRWRILITRKIFKMLINSDYEVLNSQNSASFISVITNVIPYIISNYLHQIINFLQTLILASMLIGYMLYINHILFIAVTCVGGVVIFSFLYFRRRHIAYLGGENQLLNQRLLNLLQQSITGYKETKIHQKEIYFQNKFEKVSTKAAKIDLAIHFTESLPNVLIEYIAITIIFVSFASMLIFTSTLHYSATQISIVLLMGLRIVPLVNRTITTLAAIRVSSEPIQQLLELTHRLNKTTTFRDCEFSRDPVNIKFEHELKLENVSFRYANNSFDSLRNINVVLKKGEHIGIVGASGSGKTTLVNIILGFLINYNGKYYIDQHLITPNNLNELRKLLSYVDQQPFLLDSDFIANIAYGEEKENVDIEKIFSCLQYAGLLDYVNSLPKGLATSIGENGKFLSGGQRQRVAIARALYKGAQILVLDEASSALDMDSENQLINTLEKLNSSMLIISIAHRLSTLRKCDRVLLIEHGEIVTHGSFKELYSTSPVFKSYADNSMIEVR